MCSPRRKGHEDLTSSPPSSGFTPAVPVEFPPSRVGNYGQGLRSLRDLTQHPTTRADDSHAAPVVCPSSGPPLSRRCQTMSNLGKVLRVVVELNHMLHRLCGPPSIPLSFSFATVLPRRGTYCVSSGTETFSAPTPSAHRLRRGLPGYLIPFAPHAVAPQRQCPSRQPPSPPTFFLISTHFTAPPGIPLSPPALQSHSFASPSAVKPRAFTGDLSHRLRALYAQSFRTTLAPSVLPRLLARS